MAYENPEETKEHIKNAAHAVGLTGIVAARFALFFMRRFSDDYNTYGYVYEWARRFASGKPETWMDSESLEAYKYACGVHDQEIATRNLEKIARKNSGFNEARQ